MACKIEGTAEFVDWYLSLGEVDFARASALVSRLEAQGVHLGYPCSSQIKGARLSHLRELRSSGHTLRILYAFDPRRVGVLLVGGDKMGNARWYEMEVPRAERLYARHLDTIRMKKEKT